MKRCACMLVTWLISFTCQRSHISALAFVPYLCCICWQGYQQQCLFCSCICMSLLEDNKPLNLNLVPTQFLDYMSATAAEPSHHLVFDHLQYAKMKGEGLVYFITWMTSGRQREEGVPDRKNAFRTCVLHFELGAAHFCFANIWNFSLGGRNYKVRPQACSFDGGPLPPLPRLDTDIFHMINWARHLCILQAIKN